MLHSFQWFLLAKLVNTFWISLHFGQNLAEISSTISSILQGKVSLRLCDLQSAHTDRLFAYLSARFAAQHQDLSFSPWLTVSLPGPQSCVEHKRPQSGRKVLAWHRAVSYRCSLAASHDQLQIGTAAGPLVWAPGYQTHSWLGPSAVASPAPTQSTCRGLKVLTILLVKRQTDLLHNHRLDFKLRKTVREVTKTQRWVLAKAIDGPGHQPPSFVCRS